MLETISTQRVLASATIVAAGALLIGGCSYGPDKPQTKKFGIAVECPPGFLPQNPQIDQAGRHKFDVNFACLSESDPPETKPPVNVRKLGSTASKPDESQIIISYKVYDTDRKSSLQPSSDYLGSWVINNADKINPPVVLNID